MESNEDLLSHNFSSKHRGIERIWISHCARIAAQSVSHSYCAGRRTPRGACRTRGIFGCALLVLRRHRKRCAPGKGAAAHEAGCGLVQLVVQHIWAQSASSLQRTDDTAAGAPDRTLYSRDAASPDGHRGIKRCRSSQRKAVQIRGCGSHAHAAAFEFCFRPYARISQDS